MKIRDRNCVGDTEPKIFICPYPETLPNSVLETWHIFQVWYLIAFPLNLWIYDLLTSNRMWWVWCCMIPKAKYWSGLLTDVLLNADVLRLPHGKEAWTTSCGETTCRIYVPMWMVSFHSAYQFLSLCCYIFNSLFLLLLASIPMPNLCISLLTDSWRVSNLRLLWIKLIGIFLYQSLLWTLAFNTLE